MLALLGSTACAPEPRWLAVGASSSVAILAPGDSAPSVLSTSSAADAAQHIADVEFGPGGASLYLGIVHGGGSTVEWINRSTGLSLGMLQLPRDSLIALQLLPNARSLAVTTVSQGESALSGSVLQILPTDLGSPGRRIPLCETVAVALATHGVRDRMYGACQGDELVEIDSKLGVRVRSVLLSPTRGDPACDAADVHTSANGSVVFVLCARSGTLLYLDRVQLTPFDSLPVGIGGQRLARTPSGQHVAITRPRHNELVVVDVRRRIVTHRVGIGRPSDVTIGIDGRSAFVTATTAMQSRLHRVTLATGDISSQRLPVPAGGRVVVWPGPKSPKMRWHHQP